MSNTLKKAILFPCTWMKPYSRASSRIAKSNDPSVHYKAIVSSHYGTLDTLVNVQNKKKKNRNLLMTSLISLSVVEIARLGNKTLLDDLQ